MRRSLHAIAMTRKEGVNLKSVRKSLKVIINGKVFKKRNSEFINKKFMKNSMEIETSPNKIKISVLNNQEFFNIIKVDPRLDKYNYFNLASKLENLQIYINLKIITIQNYPAKNLEIYM
jgi:hypothetical protein